MRAFSIQEPKIVTQVDISTPTIGAEDVLVRIQRVGLCGSDLNTYRGSFGLTTYPRIPGHEVSGVVVDKGDKVPGEIQIGAKVTLSPYTECGYCPACRDGRPNCCQNNQTLGVQRDGAMTSQLAFPFTKIFKSQALSLEELALVEPLSVGYHAANRGRVAEVDTVLVIGCGLIGIGAILAANRKGARVIAADIYDQKLSIALKFGAHTVINTKTQNTAAEVARLTHGEGADVVLEAVGSPQTYQQAIELVRYAGRVVYVGYAKKEVCFDSTDFVRKELDILGSRNALRVFNAVIQMLEKREFPFAELISKIYPFKDTASAFKDWDAAPGNFTKILIDLSEA